MNKLFAMTVCMTLATSVQAAPAAKPASGTATTTAATTTAAATPAPVATQSDVIGSKEAPGVFNIVPWKDKATQIQKKEISTSILRETLQPLDRDVLLREIEFHRSITTP